jgi:queuosine precursor transporter
MGMLTTKLWLPRIIAASLFTYLIVQRIDCFTYGFLKKKFDGNYLVLRNYGAILFSQLIDTVLFSFLGLYGIIESIVPVMVISYCIKVIVVLIATPFLWFSRKIMSDKKL